MRKRTKLTVRKPDGSIQLAPDVTLIVEEDYKAMNGIDVEDILVECIAYEMKKDNDFES
jgi:hypothetical protein